MRSLHLSMCAYTADGISCMLDEHFPQHLVQGERLKSIRDEPLQGDDAVGDPGREVRLGEQRQGFREIDVAHHAVGRDDAHFARHDLAQRKRHPPGRDAHLQQRPPFAYHRERLLDCGRRAGSLDRQVHPASRRRVPGWPSRSIHQR